VSKAVIAGRPKEVAEREAGKEVTWKAIECLSELDSHWGYLSGMTLMGKT
jgi:hypothetical protein